MIDPTPKEIEENYDPFKDYKKKYGDIDERLNFEYMLGLWGLINILPTNPL